MRRKNIKDNYIDPDEIFLDSSNLPDLDTHQFEGRMERPISKISLRVTLLTFFLVGFLLAGWVTILQVVRGDEYAKRSQNNTFRYTEIRPDRGIIYDRRGVELAWNNPARAYINQPGFSHLLGYIGYPTALEVKANDLGQKDLIGRHGAEESFNNILGGKKGLRLEEVDALGNVQSDHNLSEADSGKPITLSIDSRLQGKFFALVQTVARERDFVGGAGVIMDVRTGEIISLVSYPEYDSNVMTSRSNQDLIKKYLVDASKPFLNRAISGLYAPGSVFKPIIAIGALVEGVIDPAKQILSTGQIEIPNPYDPKLKSVFRDWQPQGWVDMRQAISVSSDVYFYEVGGGFQGQPGLGINNIKKYAEMFGLSTTTGIELGNETDGTIPDPVWKAANYEDKTWRVGDTYHTAIGQYGVQVTPIQMARVTVALANNGFVLKPTIIKQGDNFKPPGTQMPVPSNYFAIVREGMRLAVLEGTAKGLNTVDVKIAAKTGTAELGVSKINVNSWVMGFFPYDNPRYAFAVVMERGHRENTIGGVFVIRSLVDWMAVNTPEYFARPDLLKSTP
ncbi:MAG: penicillin-binding transpeptidase domain-containing protein [Patescibacteria group bacterium]